MNSGYLYVLVNPSEPILHKIGVKIHPPEKRLAQHNRQFDKYAGQIVKETGQEWVLKTYVSVDDPYLTKKVMAYTVRPNALDLVGSRELSLVNQ
jgi:hypothetical protein